MPSSAGTTAADAVAADAALAARIATLRTNLAATLEKLAGLRAHLINAVDGAAANTVHIEFAEAVVRDLGLHADEKIAWIVRNPPPPPAPETVTEPAPAKPPARRSAPAAKRSAKRKPARRKARS